MRKGWRRDEGLWATLSSELINTVWDMAVISLRGGKAQQAVSSCVSQGNTKPGSLCMNLNKLQRGPHLSLKLQFKLTQILLKKLHTECKKIIKSRIHFVAYYSNNPSLLDNKSCNSLFIKGKLTFKWRLISDQQFALTTYRWVCNFVTVETNDPINRWLARNPSAEPDSVLTTVCCDWLQGQRGQINAALKTHSD